MSISESDRSGKGSAAMKRRVLLTTMPRSRGKRSCALTDSKGRVGGATGAAARMGINRNALVSRVKKFGIYPKLYV